jgi:hypothetical protein
MVVPCLVVDRWLVGLLTRALFACPCFAPARLTGAHLHGTIADWMGGVLPGATVTATSVGTNLSRAIVSIAERIGRGPLLAAR